MFVVWGSLLALLLGNCWFWSHDGIDTANFAYAVTTTVVWAVVLTVRRRESLRPGPPRVEERPEALPTASLGAVMLAWGVATAVFGLAFGHFLIYFGIGLAVVAVGALARERHNERALLRRFTDTRRA